MKGFKGYSLNTWLDRYTDRQMDNRQTGLNALRTHIRRCLKKVLVETTCDIYLSPILYPVSGCTRYSLLASQGMAIAVTIHALYPQGKSAVRGENSCFRCAHYRGVSNTALVPEKFLPHKYGTE